MPREDGLDPERLTRDLLPLVEETGELGLWTWDLRDGRVQWSNGMYHILGMRPFAQEPSGDLYNSIVHPDDRAARNDAAGVLRTIGDRPHRILRTDGQVRWVRSRGRVLHDSDGAPKQAIGVTYDITERMRAEAAYQRESGLVELVQDLWGGIVWVAAADGDVAQIPDLRLAAAPYNLTRSGWARPEDVHPDDRAEAYRTWEHALRTGERYAAAFRAKLDGEFVEVASRAVAFLDPQGAILGWIGYTAPRTQPIASADTDQPTSTPTAAQIRGARGLLGWTAGDLAQKSGLSFSTIRRAETDGKRVLGLPAITAIRATFSASGVQFLTSSDGTVSVSLLPGNRLAGTRGQSTARPKTPPK